MAARLIARRCPTDLEKQASRNASDAPPRDDVAVLRATEQIALAVAGHSLVLNRRRSFADGNRSRREIWPSARCLNHQLTVELPWICLSEGWNAVGFLDRPTIGLRPTRCEPLAERDAWDLDIPIDDVGGDDRERHDHKRQYSQSFEPTERIEAQQGPAGYTKDRAVDDVDRVGSRPYPLRRLRNESEREGMVERS